MNTALKEWASVVAALGTGLQIVLRRRGGIVETKRGVTLLHPEFLLFPTFEHQHAASLKPQFQQLFSPPGGDGIPIEFLARVTAIFPAPDSINASHLWNAHFFAMRRDYRPDLPLSRILLRVYRPAHPCSLPNRSSHAGCQT